MNRKEMLQKRNKIKYEICMLNKARGEVKDGHHLNKQIAELKKQYMFYNNMLKYTGGENDN